MTTTTNEFGRIRSFLWPIHSFEIKKFLPLLLIYSLIVFNYSTLKAFKDSLVITARSSGAEAIPYIKVWAILPMAIIVTFLFTRLFNRFSQEKVFYIIIGGFLSFFLLFSTVLYPLRDVIHPHALADSLELTLPAGLHGLISIFRNWSFTLFYVMSELWGTTIMTVLFWGLANEVTSVKDAKRFYAILGVGANIATIIAGQITVWLSQTSSHFPIFGKDSWGQSLGITSAVVIASGLLTMAIFRFYIKQNAAHTASASRKPTKSDTKMSLKKNFSYLAKSKYLICIAIIVVAFNLAINMVEIIWKDQIKLLYPNPADFNIYMGKVLMATGTLSSIVGLFICGNVIRRFGWTISALITPAILLVTGALFFTTILADKSHLASLSTLVGATPLAICVFLGALQNIFSRTSKFTLFDATKEIAFIPLSTESKIKGKAAIDGVGSRLGKSGGSILHLGLLMVFGSISLSTPFVGIFILLAVLGWMGAAKSLGKQFNDLTAHHEMLKIDETNDEEIIVPEELDEEALV